MQTFDAGAECLRGERYGAKADNLKFDDVKRLRAEHDGTKIGIHNSSDDTIVY